MTVVLLNILIYFVIILKLLVVKLSLLLEPLLGDFMPNLSKLGLNKTTKYIHLNCCYSLNVCAPPPPPHRFMNWNTNGTRRWLQSPNGDGIRKCLGLEGLLVFLWKRHQRKPQFLCKDTKRSLQPRARASPVWVGTLMPDFQLP